MRSLSLVLALGVAAVAACEDGPGAAGEPPVLTVTSPMRGLQEDQTGPLVVTGTALPNAKGDPIASVVVNGVRASLADGGSFTATIDVPAGASLIETVASDVRGHTASDTRAVEAGRLSPVGVPIESAVSVGIAADAFAQISGAAGPFLQSLDMAALLAPLQPMVHVGDDNGEDCAFARAYVDDIKFSDIKLSLSPVEGGLAFRAEIDGLAVPAHVRYALLCVTGSETLVITADQIVVAGTLDVLAKGSGGFDTHLVQPDVTVTNFQIDASGVPGDVLDLLHLDSAIGTIISTAAEIAMNPLMNQALGALGGPQQLVVQDHPLQLQVAPSTVAFDPDGAIVAMTVTAQIPGSESSPGFVFSSGGAPVIEPAHGFQLGLAANLTNELLAEATTGKLLDLVVPAPGGSFDLVRLHATLPPVLNADAADGKLHLVLGDMLATFLDNGAPVGSAAINAVIDVSMTATAAGGIAVQLGTPSVHIDMLRDTANTTGLDDQDLSNAVTATLLGEIDSITKLLATVPLPAVAGLQMRDLSVGADHGYLMVSGQFN